MSDIPGRTVALERNGLLVFLAGVSAALLAVVWPFIMPVLWAALAAIIFQPLYQWFLRRFGGHANPATIATLLVITFAVILPALAIGTIIVEQAVAVFFAFRDGDINVADWFAQVMGALPRPVQATLGNEGWGNFSAAQDRAQLFAKQSVGLIAGKALSIGGSVFSWVLAFGLGLYVTYFLLRDGRELGARVVEHMPMQHGVATRLADRFLMVVRATIKGSIVVGIVQGMLGAITFWIAGMPLVLLFGLLMAIASLIPAVGAALIWGPVAIYLLATGAVWQGLMVIFSGVAVIGMADNLLRPILVGRDTGIPDWLILVTTLGGIAVLGLSGIVLGPLAAGLFITGWAVLREERGEPVSA